MRFVQLVAGGFSLGLAVQLLNEARHPWAATALLLAAVLLIVEGRRA